MDKPPSFLSPLRLSYVLLLSLSASALVARAESHEFPQNSRRHPVLLC